MDQAITPLKYSKNSAAATFSCRVISEPAAGLSRARNKGWQCANGDIVAFTDDDCYPQSDYPEQIMNCFLDGKVDYVGGRILLYDVADYPITIQTRETAFQIDPMSFIATGFIQGANMAARKQVLMTVNGFDEALGAGTAFPCEDIDFVSRASASGFIGRYDPRPVVFHHHRRRTTEQIRNLMRSYDVGRGAYFMKCLLDPTRRRNAARNWFWTIRTRVKNSARNMHSLLAVSYEAQGALWYLYKRLIA